MRGGEGVPRWTSPALIKEIGNALGKIKLKTGSVGVHFVQCAVLFLGWGGNGPRSCHCCFQEIWSELELSKSSLLYS